MVKTVVLIILDGFGIGRKDANNPIHLAKPLMLNYFKKNFLYGTLQSSGISVGLPWNEEGNSEVGHITLGAGKVVYQHYPRISLTIRDGSFFKNQELKKAFAHAKDKNSAVHLVGEISIGNVHASFEHLEALLELAKQEKTTNLFIHLITDGRDSPPRSAKELIKKLESVIKEKNIGRIASISGRYYSMDRDDHYDRTELAYRAMTSSVPSSGSAANWLDKNYTDNLNDEYIKPINLDPDGIIRNNDSIIFFNFREDSIRQLSQSFIEKNFNKFPIAELTDIYPVTFTHYSPKLISPVAFPSETVKEPLGKVIADAGLVQLRIAETEKYAHITYFFNALQEAAFPNEYRVLIPSQNLARHDEHPEMRVKEITDRIIQSLSDGGSNFILANFANPDVIAHTGNFDAAVQAVNIIDNELRRIFDAVMTADAALVITSDHGNIEEMRDPLTGAIETKHDPNPVPIYIIGKDFVSIKENIDLENIDEKTSGLLSDVAPTILNMLHLPVPNDMTGENLLDRLE